MRRNWFIMRLILPFAFSDEDTERDRHSWAKPDAEIDYSDIPQLGDDFWKKAYVIRFTGLQTSTTVRIDSDVLLWLRAQGKATNLAINAILRREMLESVQPTVTK